jgi:hypothetical protein
MTLLEVIPERSGWVVTRGRESKLSTHTTYDAAVRAARSLLEREDDDGELIVRDRYARTVRFTRSAPRKA